MSNYKLLIISLLISLTLALCLSFLIKVKPKIASSPLEDRVKLLIDDINKNPNKLQTQLTPAGGMLIDIGTPSLKFGVLELLLSSDQDTRRRAEVVLRQVSWDVLGGRAWNDPEDKARWESLWKSNGSYGWGASYESRKDSYEKWKSWLEQQ